MNSHRLLDNIPFTPMEETTARAGIIVAPGKIEWKEINIPEPGKGEVRIKIEGCGLCASGLPVWEGREWFDYPVTPGNPGHEVWGTIDAIGEGVEGFALRNRVTGLSFNGFATHDIAKAEHLVVLPDFLDGKPFPGEPIGCAMNIFKRAEITVKDTVAVIGCGFLGLLLIQTLKAADCKVIAISRRGFSLIKALEAGADEIIHLDDHQEIIEKVKEITDGKFCDRVIECTGKEWPLNLGIELTRTRGKLIVAGFHQDGMRSVNMQLLNWRGIDLISAHERNPMEYVEGIKNAIEATQLGIIYPFDLITHSYSPEELEKGFQDLQQRPDGFVKGIMLHENNE